MKTYRGYFQIQEEHYTDEVEALCKLFAYYQLKLRNSFKLQYILKI